MRKYNISIIVFYIAIIALSRLAVASQEPENLFYDAGITWERQSHDNTIIRARYVNINLGLLPESLPPKGQESEKYDVRLNLFNDAAYDIVFTKIEKSKATSTIIWTGHMPGEKPGRLTIAVTNNVAAGSIRTGDGNFYHIGYDLNGVHIIKQINESKIPPELPPIPVSPPNSYAPPEGEADSGAIIDVMVVYTTAAKNGAGGQSAIESIINSSVSTMNTTFSNSGITPRMNLVHTAEVSYTRGESGSTSGFTVALEDLTGKSDGYMDNVHSLRDMYRADMVQLLFDNNSLGGLAWLMTNVSIAFESYAFSVVHYGFADGWAFDHELGHNMGMSHDRANSSSGGAYSYSYGYLSPSNSWHTVMAYDCSGGCPRIDYWSNPDVIDSGTGEAMGIAVGSPGQADARTSNNNTAYTVANWREGGTVIVNPLPDIKVNGLDGPLRINQGDLLTATVSLDPGNLDGDDADWWVYATSPFGTYWYTLNSGWLPSNTPIRVYGGALFNLSPYTVLNMSTLPVGDYTFIFAVDDNMDNIQDNTYADTVLVTIKTGGINTYNLTGTGQWQDYTNIFGGD